MLKISIPINWGKSVINMKLIRNSPTTSTLCRKYRRSYEDWRRRNCGCEELWQTPFRMPLCFFNMSNLVISERRKNYNRVQLKVCPVMHYFRQVKRFVNSLYIEFQRCYQDLSSSWTLLPSLNRNYDNWPLLT